MTRKQHLEQASHNEKFFHTLRADHDEFSDWIVSGIFYSALHLMDAFLTTRNVLYVAAHYERNSKIQKHCPEHIYGAYRRLLDQSRLARYEFKRFSPSQLDRLLTGPFTRVKEFVVGELKLEP